MIANPFTQIFEKSIECPAQGCDLKARKEDAIGWLKQWVGGETGGRLQLADSGASGIDVVYNIGLPGKTCYAHCSIGPGDTARSTKCRIMTPADPSTCNQTIISVTDTSSSPAEANVNWNLGIEASNRGEFQNVRAFLGRFNGCSPGGSEQAAQQPTSFFANSSLRGMQAKNIQVGFVDADKKKKFGFCVVKKSGESANPREESVLQDMRQPSGLDALLFSTPNPRMGGSLNPEQCEDVLNIQLKMCVQKFNDRKSAKVSPIGIQGGFSECSTGKIPARSACENRKIRDACLGITNWDAAEPDPLKDESDRFGVPDPVRHCVIPAGATTNAGLVRTDATTIQEATQELASTLPTQVPLTTSTGQILTDNAITTRTNNCFAKCYQACTNLDKQEGEHDAICAVECSPLVLDINIKDDFSNATLTCDINMDEFKKD